MKKAIVSLFLLITFFFPVRALASNYGECAYGAGGFGEGGCASTAPGSTDPDLTDDSTTPQACNDQKPGTRVPWLYGAVSQSSSSIMLYFTEAESPITKYVLEYGIKSGEYSYGVDDMGVNERNQMTYLVQALSPGTTYYFRIRGQNGCATGEWSNELSARTTGNVAINQLVFTESELAPDVEESATDSTDQTYTVQAGDTLWGIAQELLGDGSLYKTIIELNKDKYPSLTTSNNLEVGWVLIIGGDQQNEAGSTQDKEDEYRLTIKVLDTDKKIIEGAKVTMLPESKVVHTNKDGFAEFAGVVAGNHKIVISYKNMTGEQSVNLSGDGKEFNLTITVQEKPLSLSPMVYLIIGVLALVIITLVVLVRWRK